MYVFIYRLQSENFEHDHYIEGGGGSLRDAFIILYNLTMKEEKVLTPDLFVKAINGMSASKDFVEFYESVVNGAIKIVDIFSGCSRVDIGQALSPA